MRHLIFLLRILRWLADNIRDDLLQIFILELRLFAVLFNAVLCGLWLDREEISSRARNGINCLLQLGVYSFPSLIFKDAGRLRLSMLFGMRPVLMGREVKIISE